MRIEVEGVSSIIHLVLKEHRRRERRGDYYIIINNKINDNKINDDADKNNNVGGRGP